MLFKLKEFSEKTFENGIRNPQSYQWGCWEYLTLRHQNSHGNGPCAWVEVIKPDNELIEVIDYFLLALEYARNPPKSPEDY